MIYEIKRKSDLLTGMSLHVVIPDDELDKKALYTIQADKPDFILPFRYISIDGQIEFIYQIGSHSKLQYLSGVRSPKEYAELWSGVLCPMLVCGDWFMKPYSFLLNSRYLYWDKNKKSISYVYIPSVRESSGYSDLKEMAAEITKLVTVDDADLENKVLRAIMKDFDPNGFLQMLKAYVAANEPAGDDGLNTPRPEFIPEQRFEHEGSAAPVVLPVPINHEETPVRDNAGDIHIKSAERGAGEIIINLPFDRISAKKARQSQKENDSHGGKKEKEQKKQKVADSLFGKKKELQQDIIPAPSAPMQSRPVALEPDRAGAQVNTAHIEASDVTQSISEVSGAARFRLVGSILLPPFIDVRIAQGEAFTIGRFDAAVGRQQSDFEFEKKTKAVSRRHAAIERDADGHSIIDLASSAGTYVNGQKIPPNTPFELGYGCRVSFGNAGADYIWEGQ